MTAPSAPPVSRTLAALIEEMAQSHASVPAIICGGDRLSYRDLEAESAAVARGLMALGAGPGERVAALMSNRPEFLVLYFAVARTGAVFAPLNTWHKPPELAWTLRHLEPRVLIVEAAFAGRDYAAEVQGLITDLAASEPGGLNDPAWPSLRSVVVLGTARPGMLDWDSLQTAGRGVTRVDLDQRSSSVSPDQTFQILYTSGSTADPKGVTLTHRSTVENCFNIGERRALEAGDLVWMGSPLFYALGAVNGIPATLTHGATLVTQGRFDPEAALDTIERLQVNVLYSTSNIIRALYESPAYSRRRVRSLEKGAAGISVAERRLLIEEMGAGLATQSFGLTEVYGHCAVGFPQDSLRTKLETDGAPLPGNEFKIVDPESGERLVAGRPGLLLVRGHVSREYFRDPEATAGAWDEEGFFATGDLGHLDADGYFHFQARLKEVIKTRGINVSPADLEQILMAHPDIKQAHVVGIPDPRQGELVVAFVEAPGLDEGGVQDFVRRRAASFKVPARVFFRTDAELPRVASGKVPKFRLRDEAMRELTGDAG